MRNRACVGGEREREMSFGEVEKRVVTWLRDFGASICTVIGEDSGAVLYTGSSLLPRE